MYVRTVCMVQRPRPMNVQENFCHQLQPPLAVTGVATAF